MAYAVGLTGGIGSGKTSVAEMFRALGAAIVDTDEISRALTAPGGSALPAIAQQFGSEFVATNGGLDRERMRRVVFTDADARQKLEAILHPAIRREVDCALGAATAPYAILVVPLLIETGAYRDVVRRILVVDCGEDLQVRRVVERSGLRPEEVRAIMATQATRGERLARADDVVANEGDMPALRSQVFALHAKYLGLAAQAQAS